MKQYVKSIYERANFNESLVLQGLIDSRVDEKRKQDKYSGYKRIKEHENPMLIEINSKIM